MPAAAAVQRTVSVSLTVNYIGSVPSSLAVACSGLTALAVVKVLVNGVTATTLSLDALGHSTKSYLPNVAQTNLLKLLRSASFTFPVDAGTGKVAEVSAGNGVTNVTVTVTY